jgi:tetratricopeptide (TPR) repeat protein
VHAPMPVEGCPQIGVAYRKLEMEDKAAQSFERCLAIEENSDNLLFMATVHERKGQYQKADELYSRAIKRAPEYTDVIIGKARVELRTGKAVAAKRRILELLDRQPDNADALLVAGMACLKLGDVGQARRHLTRGRRVRPTDSDFGVMLARAGSRRFLGNRQ